MTVYVEVNEGVIDITRQGVRWWYAFAQRMQPTGRLREVKPAAVVGGVTAVDCASKVDADWLAEHMVTFGGVPRTAVRVRAARKGRQR